MKKGKVIGICCTSVALATVVAVPVALAVAENQPINPLPTNWTDLTNIYVPNISPVVGPVSEGSGYNAAAETKAYYFKQVAANAKIYQEDFYFGHSMYLQGLRMDKSVIIEKAGAHITDVSCQYSGNDYEWETEEGTIQVPIYKMSFTVEFEVTMTNVNSYLEMSDVKKVTNKGKFIVKEMPMWLAYYDTGDYSYTYGNTPEFFIFDLYYQGSDYSLNFVKKFNWSIEQDTNTTLIRSFPGTDVEYTVEEPVHIWANDQDSLNVLTSGQETLAGIDDVCSSYYMSKVDMWGK